MEKGLLHVSQINKLVRGNAEFSFVFVEASGEVVTGLRCVCTSFYSAGRTMNVKWIDSGAIRKVRRCAITEFNGMEVVL